MNYLVPRTVDALDRLVAERAEEGTFLEFKSARALSEQGKFKAELPRDVSAFANAGGGVLVIGIEEDANNCASKVEGYRDAKVQAGWFEDVLLGNVRPRLPDLEVILVDHPTGKVFVIHAPLSYHTPHQASDRKFYARRQRRRDDLDLFEIELLRLRRQQDDQGVFGALVIADQAVWAVVENRRVSPIFDVRLVIPEKVLRGFEQQPRVCVDGLGVVGARSDLKYFMGSVFTLFGNADVASRFEYVLNYRLDETDKSRELRGQLSLSDIAGAAIVDTDIAKLAQELPKAINKVVDAIKHQGQTVAKHLAAMHEPTGLALSASTLGRLQHLMKGTSTDKLKWRGEWLSVEGFEELFGIERAMAQKLSEIFRYRRVVDEKSLMKPLSEYEWLTSDLEGKLRARLQLPDWM